MSKTFKKLVLAGVAGLALTPLAAEAKPRGVIAQGLAPLIGDRRASQLDDAHKAAGKPLDRAAQRALESLRGGRGARGVF